MVEIELECSLTTGQTVLLRGHVRNVGDTARPTLLCELDHGDLEQQYVGRWRLNQFPAIPLPLCVARAIQSAIAKKSGPQLNLRKSLERACIKLFVGGQERLDFVLWRIYDEFEDEIGMLPTWGREAMTPWRLGQRMLDRAATVWPSGGLQTMPPVGQEADEVEYCRAGDLPGPLRALFERQYCLAPQPRIEGVPDAFFASDVARFLSILEPDNPLVTAALSDALAPPAVGETEREWPDLTTALRKLHELGLADGDVGYAYWHDVAKLLKSAQWARKRIGNLERELSTCLHANKTSKSKGRASRRSS